MINIISNDIQKQVATYEFNGKTLYIAIQNCTIEEFKSIFLNNDYKLSDDNCPIVAIDNEEIKSCNSIIECSSYKYIIKYSEIDGVLHIYLGRVLYTNKELIVKESCIITIPEAKNQEFDVTIVGGGSGIYENISYNAECNTCKLILSNKEKINITIGAAGQDGMSGGTTSFGTYIYALGGNYNNSEDNEIFEYNGINYGSGGINAKDGVCIIKYQAPLYT